MYRSMIVLIFVSSISYADSANQTDWSGGPGVLGPVVELGTEFNLDTGVSYSDPYYIDLEKTLIQIPIKTVVNNNINVYSMDCVDINGDGYIDILCTDKGQDDIIWWENVNGYGEDWVMRSVDGGFDGADIVNSADINGDGYMDVIGAAMNEYYVPWWENVDGTGTIWTEHSIATGLLGISAVASSDVNDDGYMDVFIATYHSYDNEITWWENVNGLGLSWIEHSVGEYGPSVQSVCSEDVNGDGYTDVIGASNFYKEINWWENVDGSGSSWTKHQVCSDFTGAYSVSTADINGDGYSDILGASLANSYIIWWENVDGSGTDWIEHTVGRSLGVHWSVDSADINGDGYMDVVTALDDGNAIIWCENVDGSGIDWVEHLVDAEFYGAKLVCTEDINGDGYTDVIGGSWNGLEIAWWNPHEYAPNGWLESSILDTESSPQWASIEWNSSVPEGTDLYFKYRTSADPEEMGMWSDPLYYPCLLSGLLDRYFQYKVFLESTASDTSPSLYDVTLQWDPVSIEEAAEAIPPVISLLPISPNPSTGSPVIGFGLPEPSYVVISIFDLSGRLVSEAHGADYSSGYHDIQQQEGMSPGVYFCRMISGDFSAEQRFVVIK